LRCDANAYFDAVKEARALKIFELRGSLSRGPSWSCCLLFGDNGTRQNKSSRSDLSLVRGESFRAGTSETYIRQTQNILSPTSMVKATIERNGMVRRIGVECSS